VLPGDVAHRVADQVDHAGLHDRLRPGRGDRLRQARQAVAAHDEHVAHATVANFGEHSGPELRALGLLDPHTQDPFPAVHVDPDYQVAGLDPDLAAVTDPDPDRVDVEDRVDLLQRPVAPPLDGLVDRVGDVRDRLVRDLGAVADLEVLSDVAGGHPLRVQREHHVFELAQPAGALGDHHGVELAVAVTRLVQLDRPRVGVHRR